MMRRAIVAILLAVASGGLSSASALAEEACPNATLRTGLSANLSDCRAYELVSPADKDGGSIGVLNFDFPNQLSLPMESNADGSAIEYTDEIGQYTSVRFPSGWSTPLLGDDLSLTEAPVEAPPPVLPASAKEPGAQIVEETADGSKVFFMDEENLTSNSTAAPGEPDLYEYTVPSKQLTDLTIDTNSGEHADVQGVLGVGGEGAEMGSYVYFVANGILDSPGASRGKCVPFDEIDDRCNLYVYHDGSVEFVTAVSGTDNEPHAQAGEEGASRVYDWSSPSARTAQVSPNGRYLAFGSNLALTGQGAAGAEIFRYSVQAAKNREPSITCVSCSSTPGVVVPIARLVPSPQTLINGANRQRYMLDDGRVFFDTHAALVPQDTNGQTDVYEWEAGAAHLISSGASTAHSVFTDASANGSDAFFTTAQSLVPQDTDASVGQDSIVDLYDARENGGFPPPPGPACAIEAACPGASPASPTLLGAPTSATFSGSESVPPAPEAKRPGKPKPFTRAQKLKQALKACHAKPNKRKRAACEATANRRYGVKSHTRKAKKRG